MENAFQVHWPYLALALAMLWYPRQWMRFGKWLKKRRRERETIERFAQDGAVDPSDKSLKLGRELKAKRNYLDLLRAAVGGYALWEFSFTAAPEHATLALVLKALLVLVGVLIQAVRWRERITWFAAVFYALGLSVGLGNHVGGPMAFLLACTINPVLPTPRVFLSVFGLLLVPFGYFVGQVGLTETLVASGLILLPPLLSLLTQRPMVVFTRKRNLTW